MLLLDSQALLWLVDDSPRLGSEAPLHHQIDRAYLSRRDRVEADIKPTLGNVPSHAISPGGWSSKAWCCSTSRPSMTRRCAISGTDRHDPFDRLLVAQAQQAGLRLLTADHVLLKLERDLTLNAIR